MAKLTLASLSNLNNQASAVNTINSNSDLIEAALENTLSLDGTSPNSMASDLDLDSNDILNVGNIDVATIDAGTVDADNFTVNGTSLNILLLDWEGAWTDDTAYLVGNLVSRNGSSFICIQAHQSTTLNAPGGPNGDNFWDLVAERGNPGVVETPDTSTVNAIVRYADTLGNSFNDSGVLISDTDDVTGVGDLSLSGDIEIGGNVTVTAGDVSLPDGAEISWNSDELTVTQDGVDLVVSSAGQTSLKLQSTGGNACIEMGRFDGVAPSFPFIDFHSGATLVDYDSRIIASGGTGAIGGGDLQIAAASVSMGTTAPVTVGSLNIGHASDTTVTRTGAGDLAIEGNGIYRAGGTDIPVADGGSGRSAATAYAVVCGGTTSTGAHQSIASVGTSGQVLTSNGAGALPTFQNTSTGVVSVVASGAVSAAAQLDIALSTADMYEIDLMNFRPANDGDELYARFSQSGSFLSGASDYRWGLTRIGNATQQATAAQIQIADAVGNAADEDVTLTLRIFRPSASGFYKYLNSQGGGVVTNNTHVPYAGSGKLIANTNAIDGLRILFSTGNITSGYYAMRSYRFT